LFSESASPLVQHFVHHVLLMDLTFKQWDSGQDFFSTHFDINYLPTTKPARRQFTRLSRKPVLTYIGAKWALPAGLRLMDGCRRY